MDSLTFIAAESLEQCAEYCKAHHVDPKIVVPVTNPSQLTGYTEGTIIILPGAALVEMEAKNRRMKVKYDDF